MKQNLLYLNSKKSFLTGSPNLILNYKSHSLIKRSSRMKNIVLENLQFQIFSEELAIGTETLKCEVSIGRLIELKNTGH
jgi:hypothetical protein